MHSYRPHNRAIPLPRARTSSWTCATTGASTPQSRRVAGHQLGPKPAPLVQHPHRPHNHCMANTQITARKAAQTLPCSTRSVLITPPVQSHHLLRPHEHLAASEHLIRPQRPRVAAPTNRPENRPPAPGFLLCSRDHTFPLLLRSKRLLLTGRNLHFRHSVSQVSRRLHFEWKVWLVAVGRGNRIPHPLSSLFFIVA